MGKLTVAEALIKITDFRLFHNHLTIDLAREIYPDFKDKRWDLTDKLRMEVFESASTNNVNLIFTFVNHNNAWDKRFVHAVVDVVSSHNGIVHFVQLIAPINVLLERVSNKSRSRYHKISDPRLLHTELRKRELNPKLPYGQALELETSELLPNAAATRIADYFGLRKTIETARSSFNDK